MKIGIASLAAVDQLQGHQAVAMLDLSADSQPAEVLTAVLNVLLDLPLDFGVGAPIRLCEHASEGGRSGSDLLEGRIDLETPGRPVGSLGRRSRWRGIQLALSRRRPFVEKGLEARHAVNRHSTGACGPDLEGEGLGGLCASAWGRQSRPTRRQGRGSCPDLPHEQFIGADQDKRRPSGDTRPVIVGSATATFAARLATLPAPNRSHDSAPGRAAAAKDLAAYTLFYMVLSDYLKGQQKK
jgi:hypothetical protein